MRKNALTISCCTIAASAFGFFFRWLQKQAAFEADTGLLKPGALNYIVPLVLLGAAALFYWLLKKLDEDGLSAPTDTYSVFVASSIAYPIAFYAAAVITVLGGLISLFSAAESVMPGVAALLSLLAVVCGVSFPLICRSGRKKYAPAVVCVFMTLPILMFCLWLILSYKTNASTPTLWAYCVETLAICAALLAFFYNAGYPYGKVRAKHAMFFSMLGAFLCITTLADTRSFGLQLVMLGAAAMLIIENWLILLNRKPIEAKPVPEPETEPESVPEPEADGKVLEAGKAETVPEPTIQAPERKPRLDESVDKILQEYNDEKE